MKKYASISASDQARQHNGDVYNDCTITHVHEASSVPDAGSRCLQSLAFPHMERRGDINSKTEKTCDWVLHHPQYQAWVENAGLLWIRGRAGSGKSTIMESIVKQNLEDLEHIATDQGTTLKVLVVSFFFHRRGEMLQRTALGLFRSLLHQVLRQDRKLLSEFIESTKFELRCRDEGEPGVKWDWTASDLRERLKTCVQALGQNRPIRIYIDALDESGEASARDLMKYFHQLRSEPSLRRFSVCVSCRPYPEVIWDWDHCATVEHSNTSDIETFLRAHLTTILGWTNQALLDDVRSEIAERASGVFQGAVIVTRRVLSMKGETKEHILADIARTTPGELGDLYESMLSQLSNNDRALAFRILRWITLAARPLTLQELRHASAIEPKKQIQSSEDFSSSIHWCRDDEQMSDRVLRLSQGLVAIVKTSAGATVQYDHESVQDYMLDRGLSFLAHEHQNDIETSFIGRGHHQLAIICLRRLAGMNVTGGDEWVTYKGRFEVNVFDVGQFVSPFVEYAAIHWTTHAEMAETLGVFQAALIEYTEWPSNEILTMGSSYKHGEKDPRLTLQHVASRYGLCSVLAALIPLTRRSMIGSVKGSSRFSRWRANAIDPKDGRGQTPLSLAIEYRHEAVVRLWLDAGTAVNEKDGLGRTPLSQAVRIGHDRIVKLLLDAGAAVNMEDTAGDTPLLLSVMGAHEGIVRLLLANNKINVNACDKRGSSPLLKAVEAEEHTIVKLLLATRKVDMNACISLSKAAQFGHDSIVEALLATGKVDVNAKDEFGRTALWFAVVKGHAEVVKLLLSTHAVDLDVPDRFGRTAFLLASSGGHEIMRILLSTNAVNVKTKDQDDYTALMYAALSGNPEVVKLLLSANGVDINAEDLDGWTPLMLAAMQGHIEVLKLLLSTKGVDWNARNSDGNNAFDIAVKKGQSDVAMLLQPLFASTSELVDLDNSGGEPGD